MSTHHVANAVRASPYLSDRGWRVDPQRKHRTSWDKIDGCSQICAL